MKRAYRRSAAGGGGLQLLALAMALAGVLAAGGAVGAEPAARAPGKRSPAATAPQAVADGGPAAHGVSDSGPGKGGTVRSGPVGEPSAATPARRRKKQKTVDLYWDRPYLVAGYLALLVLLLGYVGLLALRARRLSRDIEELARRAALASEGEGAGQPERTDE